MEESTLMQMLDRIQDNIEDMKDSLGAVKVEQAIQGTKIDSIDARLATIEADRFSWSKLMAFFCTKQGIATLGVLLVVVNYSLALAGLPALPILAGIQALLGLF